MCIIIYKPKGVAMPSEEIIETCFENNPDGAGISYSAKDGVVFLKGFMDYKSFRSTLDAIKDKTSRDIVMHFRITTSGGTRPDMCHPFNIGEQISPHKSTCVLHHNGVLFSPMTKWYSDTAIFAHALKKNFDKAIKLFMDRYSMTNRFAIHSISGVLTLGKGWINADDGCMYSNDSYIPWCTQYGQWDSHNTYGSKCDYVCRMCGSKNMFEYNLSLNDITECADCGDIDYVRY